MPEKGILAKPSPKSRVCRLRLPMDIDRTDSSVAACLPPLELFYFPNGSAADWRARQKGTALLLQAHRRPRAGGGAGACEGASPSATLAWGPGKPASVGVLGGRHPRGILNDALAMEGCSELFRGPAGPNGTCDCLGRRTVPMCKGSSLKQSSASEEVSQRRTDGRESIRECSSSSLVAGS